MYKIRQISYATDSVSIQVYKIEDRKRIIVRHIGTAHSQQEKTDLLLLANDFIAKPISQQALLETVNRWLPKRDDDSALADQSQSTAENASLVERLTGNSLNAWRPDHLTGASRLLKKSVAVGL